MTIILLVSRPPTFQRIAAVRAEFCVHRHLSSTFGAEFECPGLLWPRGLPGSYGRLRRGHDRCGDGSFLFRRMPHRHSHYYNPHHNHSGNRYGNNGETAIAGAVLTAGRRCIIVISGDRAGETVQNAAALLGGIKIRICGYPLCSAERERAIDRDSRSTKAPPKARRLKRKEYSSK